MDEVKRGILLQILSYAIVVLVFVNIAIVSGTCALYIELWQLKDLEQSRLEEVFPRLPEEKLRELLNRFFPGFTSYRRETRGSLIRYEVSQGWTYWGLHTKFERIFRAQYVRMSGLLSRFKTGKLEILF